MTPVLRRSTAGLLVVLSAFVGSIVFGSNPAAAHQPVILDENDNSPDRGPELVDGTVSFAVYGSITKPGALRGLSFNLKAGDALVVDLLIPNLEPELSSPLPSITVLDPDGNPTDPPVELGETFNESFSRTSYRSLAKVRSSATKTGKYGVVVGSGATGRFVIGIGDREVRGEVKQDDAKGSIADWYATPVPAVASTVATAQAAAIATTAFPVTTAPATTTAPPPSTVAATTGQATAAGTTPAATKPDSGSGRALLVVIPLILLASLFLVARRPKRPVAREKPDDRR